MLLAATLALASVAVTTVPESMLCSQWKSALIVEPIDIQIVSESTDNPKTIRIDYPTLVDVCVKGNGATDESRIVINTWRFRLAARPESSAFIELNHWAPRRAIASTFTKQTSWNDYQSISIGGGDYWTAYTFFRNGRFLEHPASDGLRNPQPRAGHLYRVHKYLIAVPDGQTLEQGLTNFQFFEFRENGDLCIAGGSDEEKAPFNCALKGIPESKEPEQPLQPTPLQVEPSTIAPLPKSRFPGRSTIGLYTDLSQQVGIMVTAKATKYSCTWNGAKVINTETLKIEGEVKVGEDGWLYSGIITEKWTVDYCGVVRSMLIVVKPPWIGAYVSVDEYKE